jgi:HlyD family secretion protein
MNRRVIVIVGLVLAVGAGWAAYPFVFQTAGSANTLLISGNIEAHESLVSFKTVQSRIVDLRFDEGQWVAAGTPLARLDDSDYQKQVDVARAALAVQEKQLSSSLEKLAAAKATVTDDQADFAEKSVDSQRSHELFRQGVIGAQTNDLATTAARQSRAALARDQANVREAENDVEVAKASIEQARQTLQLANIMLGYTVLRAPFSGVVLVRQAELGEVMLPGSPVMTLADLDHIWLRGYISETDLERVRWGQPATITTDSYRGKTFHGRVSFIASDAEFTPKSVETHKERVTLVYRIKIDIQNPLHELKPGMPADAVIDLTAAPAQQQPTTQLHAQ